MAMAMSNRGSPEAINLLYHIETISLAIESEENLLSLVQFLATSSLVPLTVKEELDISHESVPHLTKCRYLIWSVYNMISGVYYGMEKFVTALFELPLGRKLAENYYQSKKQTHDSMNEMNFSSDDWFMWLIKMFCDTSYGNIVFKSRYPQQSVLISVHERKKAFTLLLEAKAGPSLANGKCVWIKNRWSLISKKSPILCLKVTDVTVMGTYIFHVGYDNYPQAIVELHIHCLMDIHRHVLVERYSRDNVAMADEDAWPQVSQNTYINLAIIKSHKVQNMSTFITETIRGDADDIYGEKGDINYEKAFQSINHGEVVIVEGRPGSGKTTLVHKISQDWRRSVANNNEYGTEHNKLRWSHIKALFLIHLRGFCGDPFVKLEDLVKRYFCNEEIIKTICHYITSKQGAGICFILDGLDEYQPSNKENFIFNLIKQRTLHKCIVIVASRPAAVAKYRSAKRLIEVLGFFKKQISEYIDSYNFSADPAHSKSLLKHYLQERPNVYHMCYLPIQLAMVCFLFDKMKYNIPETETAIYAEFAKHTILRSLYRTSENSEINIQSIFTMPESENTLFLKICALAFEKTILSEQVLIQSDVELCCGKINFSFGLVTIDRASTNYGYQNLYTFCHLTFQEFLAACHIFMAKEQHQHALLETCTTKKHMTVVLKFFCGLVHFGPDGALFHKVVNSEYFNCLTKIQCAYESQQPVTCKYLVETNCLNIQESFLSTRDWTAIGFVLVNSYLSGVKKLSVTLDKITEEGLAALMKKTEERKECIKNIEVFCFSGSELPINFINFLNSLHIFCFFDTQESFSLKSVISFIKNTIHTRLNIIEFQQRQKSKLVVKFNFMKLLKNLLFQHFEWNVVSCASILIGIILGGTEVQSNFVESELAEICSQMINVPLESCVKLSLCDGKISDEIVMVCESLNVKDIIREMEFVIDSVQCSEDNEVKVFLLRYLDLIPIGDYVIFLYFDITKFSEDLTIFIIPKYVCKFLKPADTNLLMVDIRFIAETRAFLDQKSLVKVPKQLKNLCILNFCSLSYPISDIIVKFSYSLKHLEFDGSCTIENDLQSLCQAFLSCINLVSVTISRSFSTDMLEALGNSKTLRQICLRDYEIQSLDPLCNLKLVKLNLKNNMLNRSFVKSMSPILNQWSQLQELCISHCNINKDLLSSLIEGIKKCYSLCALDISHNELGNTGCRRLSDALVQLVRSSDVHLHKLIVSHCGIGDNGIFALSDLVKLVSTYLFALDISHNKFSIQGADQVVSNMQHCLNLCELGLDMELKPKPRLQNHNFFMKNFVIVIQNAKKLSKLLISHLLLDPSDVETLISVLKLKNHLRVLKFSDCFSNSALGLGSMIQGNIRSLDLSNNTYTRSDFMLLCKNIQICKFLWSLNLSGTRILDEKFMTWTYLKLSSSLRELYLDEINLETGILCVAREIRQCKNLQALSCRNCGIPDKGAVVLAEGAKNNRKLHLIDLSFNKISKEIIAKMSQILIDCHSLNILHESYFTLLV